jgi:hypothetical protein
VRAHVLASAIALSQGEHSLALEEAERGGKLADASHHELFAIDALTAQTRAHLARGEARAAIATASAAMMRASDPFCSYAWGHGDAAYLLGIGCIMEHDFPAAHEALEIADRIRRRAYDPEREHTWQFLEIVRHGARRGPDAAPGALGCSPLHDAR